MNIMVKVNDSKVFEDSVDNISEARREAVAHLIQMYHEEGATINVTFSTPEPEDGDVQYIETVLADIIARREKYVKTPEKNNVGFSRLQ